MSVTIGGNKFEAKNSGLKLGRNGDSEVFLASVETQVTVGAVTALAVGLGNFQLPKNGYLRQVTLSAYRRESASLIDSADTTLSLTNVAANYQPPVSTLVPSNDLLLFKSAEQGSLQWNFSERSLFIAANRTVSIFCTVYSAFAAGQSASAFLYMAIDLE